MPPSGYCTHNDVRRALRKSSLPGDVSQDLDILRDAIVAWTEPLEKELSRHWYDPNASEGLLPTEVRTRNDEHDLPTHAGFVHGAAERERYRHRPNSDALLEAGPRHERHRVHHTEPKRMIRQAFGDAYHPETADDSVPLYTRITLNRKDVTAINELMVVNKEGGYDDWVSDSAYSGGVGNQHRGEDYWVRVNNGGVSELYLDIHSMTDDLPSLSNAVYVAFDYGHKGIPRNVRRAVAFLAGADLVEEAVIEIPSNATLYNIETKAEEMRETAEELLSVYTEGSLGINQ